MAGSRVSSRWVFSFDLQLINGVSIIKTTDHSLNKKGINDLSQSFIPFLKNLDVFDNKRFTLTVYIK